MDTFFDNETDFDSIFNDDFFLFEEQNNACCSGEPEKVCIAMSSSVNGSDVNSSQFRCSSDEYIKNTVANSIPLNTKHKAKWAIKLFNDWFEVWKLRSDGLKVLKSIDDFFPFDLNYCLRFFNCDVIKQNRE